MRLIDADALKQKYIELQESAKLIGTDVGAGFIDIAPTIEERKTGKWIRDPNSNRYRCDQCLSFALRTDDGQENLSDFCPVCGSIMGGKQNGI